MPLRFPSLVPRYRVGEKVLIVNPYWTWYETTDILQEIFIGGETGWLFETGYVCDFNDIEKIPVQMVLA